MKINFIILIILLLNLSILSQENTNQTIPTEENKPNSTIQEQAQQNTDPDKQENKDDDKKENINKEIEISKTPNQENSQESKKQESQKKWFLKLNGAYGLSNSEFGNGTTEQYGLGLDYRANPKFSFGISINSALITQKERNNSERDALILLSLISTPNQPTTSQSNPSINNSLVVAATLATPLTLYYRYSAVNLNFNYHPRGDNFFDPFFGGGAFAGACTAPVPCIILGMNLNLGIQLNWERFFIISQLQGQFYQIREPELDPFNQRNSILLLSAGVRF